MHALTRRARPAMSTAGYWGTGCRAGFQYLWKCIFDCFWWRGYAARQRVIGFASYGELSSPSARFSVR
eukprot:6188178-Pleurochrysis_carterae.AAC.2